MLRRLGLLAHPFLFALWPVITLYSFNNSQTLPSEMIVPGIVVTILTVLLLAAFAAIYGSWLRGGVVVAIFWLLLFSYSQVSLTIGGMYPQYEAVHGPTLLLAVWGLILVLLVFSVGKWSVRPVTGLAAILSVVGVALVAVPAARAVPSWASAASMIPAGPADVVATKKPATLPDIYYIILDGYARADVLAEMYGYDNSAFLDRLEQKGFFIAKNSRSNYPQTHLSLASSLNGVYLDSLADVAGSDSGNRNYLKEMIKDNWVSTFLKSEGYTYVTYSSGYLDDELGAAELYKAPALSPNQFQNSLINFTPIAYLADLQYGWHRDRLLYNFEHLPDATKIDGPVFVVAHILAPHHPFVFGSSGEEIPHDRLFTFADDDFFTLHPELAALELDLAALVLHGAQLEQELAPVDARPARDREHLLAVSLRAAQAEDARHRRDHHRVA
ncbi:MAG: hypothetical protein M0Z94_16330, partial [Dehalococcoidales bacterium]|nr:hypothetical protein [Dehalococcoidales bacterium]